MDVGFWNLSYTCRPSWIYGRREKKTLLHQVSGRFKRGELSAILGPSGAGKSTLLNAVSGFTTAGVTGSLTVNDEPRNLRTFNRSSCYITQEDLIQPYLTVHELMTVSTELKLPSYVSRKQKQQIISDILEKLGLQEAADTRTEFLSGGEKKRVSIAQELVNNPPVFFLDEPTSGLDNVTTMHCLRLLQTLARDGHTIVITIHQPSAAIMRMFDHVLVLARGYCVYQGRPSELVPFLDKSGVPCPRHYNPADYLMELTDSDESIVSLLCKATENGKILRAAIEGSEIDSKESRVLVSSTEQSNDVNSDQNHPEEEERLPWRRMECDHVSEGCTCNDFPTSRWMQFIILFRRMMLQLFRNKIGLQIQFLHHTLCALLLGTVYFNLAKDGSQFFTHMKFCIGVVLFHTYTYVMVPVLVYPFEVKLFKKEHFNRWYCLTSYYSALTLSKWPVQIILTTYFLAIVYFMSGLPEELGRFAIIVLIGILISLASEGMGLAVGAVFNVTNGSAVGPMVIAPFLGLAVYGFDFAHQIPWYVMALMRTSFLRCGVAAIVLTLFGFDRKPLECDDIHMYCHFQNPKKVLQFLDVEGQSAWMEIGNLVVIILVFRAMFWCGLRYRTST